MQERDDEPRAAHPERMAERDRTTVHVHLRAVEAELAHHRDRLRRERLVQLDEVEVGDGDAAALVVMSDRAVERLGVTPLARVSAAATAGVEPRVMGLGPVPATQKLLARTGISVADLDLVELNEAFAAQALAVIQELGLEHDRVNVDGGAIAIGHPLGMSGARLALTASLELADRDLSRALVTMCIGVGQGISLLLERP